MLIVNVICNTASLVTLLLSLWIPKTHHSTWNDVNIVSEVEVKTTSGLAAAMLKMNVTRNRNIIDRTSIELIDPENPTTAFGTASISHPTSKLKLLPVWRPPS